MEKLQIKGIVKTVTEVYQKGNFKKRSLIIATDGEYSQILEIEFVNTKEELLDLISVGDNVSVSVNLRGREWVNPEGVSKYFMSLAGWKIDVI
jgi:hypothetical protein